jgi:probable phosphoglycerate mutase
VRTERRLFLIRHGRVDFLSKDFRNSPRGRQWDPPLAADGREQAGRLCARLLLMTPPPEVFSSPFTRCLQTIEPYASASAAEVRTHEDLGEVFTGEWEGASFEEILSRDEDLARRFREQEAMFSLAPGGESGAELRGRVVPAVGRLLDEATSDDVMVVTHGGVINAYLSRVLSIEEDMFFLPDNASINTVVVRGSERRVRFLNDVRHLSDPKLFVPPSGARAQ